MIKRIRFVENRKLRVLSIIVLVILTILFCLLPITIGAMFGIDGYLEAVRWRDKTSPLDPKTVKYFCELLELPPDDPLCMPKEETYAPQLYPFIIQKLQPENGEWATFNDVEEILGQYKDRCSQIWVESDGFEYFDCRYDLRGDEVYPISIYFYPNGDIWKIIYSITD